MTRRIQVLINMIVLSFAVTAMAQKPIVYPAKGQSAQQQSKDDAECYAWAKQTTGIDPAVVASSPPPQNTGPAVGGGERVRGAVRGAAGGGAIGAIAGDAGQGAGNRRSRRSYGWRPESAPTASRPESTGSNAATGDDQYALPSFWRMHGRPRLHD